MRCSTKMIVVGGSVLWLLAVCIPCRGAEPPQFSDFTVPVMFRGKPAAVNLASAPGAQRFRTRLREGAKSGPNFADHYTVVMWGCGTNCQVTALVDAKTGVVTFAPFVAESEIAYRRNSRLLIVNPPEAIRAGWRLPEDCGTWVPTTSYYEWNGGEFRKLLEIDPCAMR